MGELLPVDVGELKVDAAIEVKEDVCQGNESRSAYAGL